MFAVSALWLPCHKTLQTHFNSFNANKCSEAHLTKDSNPRPDEMLTRKRAVFSFYFFATLLQLK